MAFTLFKKRQKKIGFTYDSERIFLAARQPLQNIFSFCQTTSGGLNEEEVAERRKKYGENIVARERSDKWLIAFIKTFINPFIGILFFLALVSMVIDVLLAEPAERDWTTIIILATMIILSALFRFIQERKSLKATEALKKMVRNTASVYRRPSITTSELTISELVPGDLVHLAAGDMIPADMRIVESKDLFVSQSTLTGESDAIEKYPELGKEATQTGSVTELRNICFMGSNVVSGSAKAIVVATGLHAYLGRIAQTLTGQRAQTSFDRGINKVSLLLIRFMLVMVPFVFLVNGITKGDWLEALIFAVSVAVGLTPEMLPMIVTSNLAKGSLYMSKRKVIVKNMNAIQSFGAMDILCTDKTGTLTQDKIVLERYMNVDGEQDDRVLRHAFINSYFQTGLKNLMDKAILAHCDEYGLDKTGGQYEKIDEIPFDFNRRRMSVVVAGDQGKKQIVTKGAIEEMLSACSHAEIGGEVCELTDDLRRELIRRSTQYNSEGLRVLGIAHKNWYGEMSGSFSVDDEKDMVLIGYLAFLDPPKASASEAIDALYGLGVDIKVLSGDNEVVTRTISRQVGLNDRKIVLGSDVDVMSDNELDKVVHETQIFAKLTPMNKARIVLSLQRIGHTVGFLGDGINDAAALRQADIGISVDSAVDIAKEAADIILLEKDLMVLENGVKEGRMTFGNIMKYIKMTASSNFGNMFSVLAASAFLPFLPMMPIHLLLQNLLYDISQTAIPFDRVDEEYLQKPRKWDSSDISRFMIWIGPISSIFDISTFIVMWYIFKCNTPEMAPLFQSGWFIVGLLSQTLIVHMIRTRKIPFIQSIASAPVTLLTIVIMGIGIWIPFSAFGQSLGMVSLPWSYFPWLIGTLLTYCILTQFIKDWYIRRFRRWL